MLYAKKMYVLLIKHLNEQTVLPGFINMATPVKIYPGKNVTINGYFFPLLSEGPIKILLLIR